MCKKETQDKQSDNYSDLNLPESPVPGPSKPTKEQKKCEICGTTTATKFRRDERKRRVCNACGIYARKGKGQRPVSLWNKPIRTRKSKTGAKGKNKSKNNPQVTAPFMTPPPSPAMEPSFASVVQPDAYSYHNGFTDSPHSDPYPVPSTSYNPPSNFFCQQDPLVQPYGPFRSPTSLSYLPSNHRAEPYFSSGYQSLTRLTNQDRMLSSAMNSLPSSSNEMFKPPSFSANQYVTPVEHFFPMTPHSLNPSTPSSTCHIIENSPPSANQSKQTISGPSAANSHYVPLLSYQLIDCHSSSANQSTTQLPHQVSESTSLVNPSLPSSSFEICEPFSSPDNQSPDYLTHNCQISPCSTENQSMTSSAYQVIEPPSASANQSLTASTHQSPMTPYCSNYTFPSSSYQIVEPSFFSPLTPVASVAQQVPRPSSFSENHSMPKRTSY